MRADISFAKSLGGILLIGLAAASCTTAPNSTGSVASAGQKKVQSTKVTFNYTAKDRDCLKRAMYFESEHSDESGYMAVGTVVMNRLTSGAYPPSICGVVAQKKQFAPGVMTREVMPQAEPELASAADAILRGARHPAVKNAMFFHTNGLKFPYNNMHYVTVAGGNAFYEKRGSDGELQTPPPLPSYEVAMNYVPGQSMMPTQFDMLVPTVVPIPTPAPDESIATGAVPILASDPVMPVAIPTPRPAYDSVMLRGSLPISGS
ncbi:cell wall hydrolase [Rhizobium sp. BK251]|uniref:cell wall hydrolase n=1 Tax=Rhizobium sp. BK251 TaxID=2512125 RepID=UPI00104FFDC6|nr:cell wall hydrolase [Rhizobium sp. BK251]TCL68255.1 cell wall hydrolase [Rhizobium sp. BK251]